MVCGIQAIWRRVQNLGLTGSYTSVKIVLRLVRRLMALAYIEPHRVLEVYSLIRNDAPPCTAELLAYFETQWLGNVSVGMWNVNAVDISTTIAVKDGIYDLIELSISVMP